MKPIACFFLTIAIILSCKKESEKVEKIEYISYDSEIFSGSDMLIYGQWKYLYSSGGFVWQQKDLGGFLLWIAPFGNYSAISRDNIITSGKLLIVDKQNNHTQIRFCKDGIKNIPVSSPQLIPISQSINFIGSDTLVLMDPCCDMYSHYYVRIK